MTARTLKYGWIAGVTGLILTLSSCESRDHYSCAACFAHKDVYQWFIGPLPVSPQWVRITNNHFQTDFFDADHAHVWQFSGGGLYAFLGTAPITLGKGRNAESRLSSAYERSEGFRKYIHTKLQDGSLTKSNFIAMAATPETNLNSPLNSQADALLDGYHGPQIQ